MLKLLLAPLIALALFTSPAQARESAHLCVFSAAPEGTLAASEVLSELQRKSTSGPHLLADQKYFENDITDRDGGGCSIATAFNLIQTVMVALGESPLKISTTIAKAYEENPNLKSGRLSNLEFAQLLRSLLINAPNGAKANVWVDENDSAAHSEQAPPRIMWRKWLKFDPELLAARRGQFKVVAYTIRSPDGRGRTRHFVVLKDGLTNGTISVVDPYRPLNRRVYTVAERLIDHVTPVLRLERADTEQDDYLYTVDTIFTVVL